MHQSNPLGPAAMQKAPASFIFLHKGNHLEPLTDQPLMGICNLQQSSQQVEDTLSQGMKALQQSLVDTLSSACLGPTGSGNIADYIGQMAIAMGKLATLKNFLQAMHSAHVPPTFQPHSRTANAIAPNVPHSALDAHFFFQLDVRCHQGPRFEFGDLS